MRTRTAKYLIGVTTIGVIAVVAAVAGVSGSTDRSTSDKAAAPKAAANVIEPTNIVPITGIKNGTDFDSENFGPYYTTDGIAPYIDSKLPSSLVATGYVGSETAPRVVEWRFSPTGATKATRLGDPKTGNATYWTASPRGNSFAVVSKVNGAVPVECADSQSHAPASDDLCIRSLTTGGTRNSKFSPNGVTRVRAAACKGGSAVRQITEPAGGPSLGFVYVVCDRTVLRIKPTTGLLDTTFGTKGFTTLPVTPRGELRCSTYPSGTGELFVACVDRASKAGANYDVRFMRLSTKGALVTTFGTKGVASRALTSGTTSSTPMVVRIDRDPSGRYGALVDEGVRHVLVRFTSTGAPDKALGGSGGAIALGGNDPRLDLECSIRSGSTWYLGYGPFISEESGRTIKAFDANTGKLKWTKNVHDWLLTGKYLWPQWPGDEGPDAEWEWGIKSGGCAISAANPPVLEQLVVGHKLPQGTAPTWAIGRAYFKLQ